VRKIKAWCDFYAYLGSIKEEEIVLGPDGNEYRLYIADGHRRIEKVKGAEV